MPSSSFVYSVRNVVMLAMVFLIWAVLTMVYFDRLVPPFTLLEPVLMPWKTLNTIPFEASVEGRLQLMQELLDASNSVAHVAFAALTGSFVVFSAYLTFLYQQRTRRMRENEMLIMKNVEILRRNEFIRYISATIGHEFKNNLGRIKRRLHLLDIPEDARRQMDVNFEKLFADIEIFKKISDEREAGIVMFEEVNLKGMIEGLARQCTDLAEFAFDAEDESPSIFASEPLLRTVFENLIDNAIKYKKPEQERALIRLSCSMDADGSRRYVSLSFRDEGVGMDEEQADRCFYKQKSTEKGWGEGLNFAKYVVGLHAGKIRVGKGYTAPGRGTEILIKLPYVEEMLHV